MEEKRNAFDEFSFAALSALGSLMACNEVCRNQRAVMKINRFRAWLMDLKLQDNPEQKFPFDGEPQGQTAEQQLTPSLTIKRLLQ